MYPTRNLSCSRTYLSGYDGAEITNIKVTHGSGITIKGQLDASVSEIDFRVRLSPADVLSTLTLHGQ